jgi:hypothetical protein
MSSEEGTLRSSVVDPASIKPEWWENLPLGKRIATIVSPQHFARGMPESQSHCANMEAYKDLYPILRGGRITGDTINLHVPHRDGSVHSYHLTMDEEARKIVELNDRRSAEGNFPTEGVEVYGIFRGTTLLGNTRRKSGEAVKPEPGVKTEPVPGNVVVKPEPGNLVKAAPGPSNGDVVKPEPGPSNGDVVKPEPGVKTEPNNNGSNKPVATELKQSPVPNGSPATPNAIPGGVSTCTSTTKPILNAATGSQRATYFGRTDPRRYRK